MKVADTKPFSCHTQTLSLYERVGQDHDYENKQKSIQKKLSLDSRVTLKGAQLCYVY